ncbi:MAG: NlpC/P60 family protein [Pseudomonadota bacterium]
MTDRRFQAANARVAHSTLIGTVQAARFTDGTPQIVRAPSADLCAQPGKGRDKQLLMGQAFTVLDVQGDHAFGFDPVDGYVGYVDAPLLRDPAPPTHKVITRLAHMYTAPDIKAPEIGLFSFGSRMALTPENDDFLRHGEVFIPRQQVAPVTETPDDPATIAELFLGTPYLWGGDTGTGIDCSGLVQTALTACGIPCPRDSDLQQTAFPATDPACLQRSDLVFWKGHVGMMRDPDTIIHANAFHMTVATEPLTTAIQRIATQYGEVTAYTRPTVQNA